MCDRLNNRAIIFEKGNTLKAPLQMEVFSDIQLWLKQILFPVKFAVQSLQNGQANANLAANGIHCNKRP